MREHLVNCKPYLNQAKVNGVANSITRQAAKPVILKQTRLIPSTLSSSQKAEIDRLAAAICYNNALPFTIFETSDMRQFLHRLNSAYKSPSRQALAGTLLDEHYVQIKEKVNEVIRSMSWINIITDESTNIGRTRIGNVSIHSDIYTFHYLSEDLRAKHMTAVGAADWLKAHLHTVADGDLNRINSISTDTSPTMYAMWEELQVCLLELFHSNWTIENPRIMSLFFYSM